MIAVRVVAVTVGVVVEIERVFEATVVVVVAVVA